MNKYQTYIVVFENKGLLHGYNPDQFHNKITAAKGIVSWWHYLSNSYILIVDRGVTATDITKYLQTFTAKTKFLVSELNLKNHNGYLTQEAWDWINNELKLQDESNTGYNNI